MGSLHEGIALKREQVSSWFDGSDLAVRRRTLGTMSEVDVREHLHQLDSALERSTTGELGLCEVCHKTVEQERLELDFDARVCLEHLSEPEARLLERELELAQSVQKTLLPQETPELDGLEIAAYSRPAQIVTGDLFDFFWFADGRLGAMVADAAGHGVSSGLQIAGLQSLVRALVANSDSPAAVMRQIHRLYRHIFRFTTLISLFLMAIDPGAGRLNYVNAGHNPPLMIRSGAARPEPLMPTGPALGLTEAGEYVEGEVPFSAGDALAAYTDGIPEAFDPNGQQFGQARFEDLVIRTSNGSAESLVRAVRDDLRSFVGDAGYSDDVTLVVFRRTAV